ncbi:MAG: class I SAM-dependent methyltransferase [Endozoicomonas sp. (ex Botrylloides leachii)]|nr:class I SAM-dependent methyltransferase [Endozoicomonas sp. (ex Botrylloides leachii)]
MNATTFCNTSQLILRNSHALQSKRCLLLAPPADELAAALALEGVVSEVVGLTQNIATHRYLDPIWQRLPIQHELLYGPILAANQLELFDSVIFFLQKSKPLMMFWLDMVRPLLAPDASLWLVGENREGIKSWRKRLKTYFSDVTVIDNARHCGLIEATGFEEVTSDFVVDHYFQSFDVSQQSKSFVASSLPGVFSHGHLDQGTAILLASLHGCKASNVLDFGCGAGVISAALALQQSDANFTLVDCDALALASTHKTLKNLKVGNYRTIASDGLSDVSGRFDLIVSNPPFHQGVKTDYQVTEQFIRQSPNYLIKGGQLRIVANSFLRYESVIEKAFGNCCIVDSRNGYTVYEAIYH